MDILSTASVGNNINMARTVGYYTEDEILEVYPNFGSNNFTKISALKILPLDIHISEDSIENILTIKYIASIPGVHITMN